MKSLSKKRAERGRGSGFRGLDYGSAEYYSMPTGIPQSLAFKRKQQRKTCQHKLLGIQITKGNKKQKRNGKRRGIITEVQDS